MTTNEITCKERAELHRLFQELEITLCRLGAGSGVQGAISACVEDDRPDWGDVADCLEHCNSLHQATTK